MVMHVALADAAAARNLARRLDGVDGTAVSLAPGRTELAVKLDTGRDRALALVVDVCTWLEGDRHRAAFVRLGAHRIGCSAARRPAARIREAAAMGRRGLSGPHTKARALPPFGPVTLRRRRRDASA